MLGTAKSHLPLKVYVSKFRDILSTTNQADYLMELTILPRAFASRNRQIIPLPPPQWVFRVGKGIYVGIQILEAIYHSLDARGSHKYVPRAQSML